jgi:hypothetical protein
MNNTFYRIIAYHDDAPGLYLISTETARDPKVLGKIIEMAQVLDTRQDILFPPTTLISLCARDHWKRHEGDQSIIADLLKQVKPFEEIEDEDEESW